MNAAAFFWMVLVICAGAPALGAQGRDSTGRVGGVVVAAGRPVAGAEVSLRNSPDPEAWERVAISDSLGVFAIARLAPGRWLLTVRRLGFAPVSAALDVVAGRDTLMRLALSENAVAIEGVTVVADPLAMPARYGTTSRMSAFYDRRKRGTGRFLTREELARTGHSDLQLVLSAIPGTRVRTDRYGGLQVWFARCQGQLAAGSGAIGSTNPATAPMPIAVFVDGVIVPADGAAELFGTLSVPDIEAIEVYRGVTELPMEAMGNGCGAIFIWSRVGTDSTASDR